jgi:hypothetical protein
MQNRGASISAVIAGLDPAIHVFRKKFDAKKKMDPRVKPAGDNAGRGEYWINSTGPRISRADLTFATHLAASPRSECQIQKLH